MRPCLTSCFPADDQRGATDLRLSREALRNLRSINIAFLRMIGRDYQCRVQVFEAVLTVLAGGAHHSIEKMMRIGARNTCGLKTRVEYRPVNAIGGIRAAAIRDDAKRRRTIRGD